MLSAITKGSATVGTDTSRVMDFAKRARFIRVLFLLARLFISFFIERVCSYPILLSTFIHILFAEHVLFRLFFELFLESMNSINPVAQPRHQFLLLIKDGWRITSLGSILSILSFFNMLAALSPNESIKLS